MQQPVSDQSAIPGEKDEETPTEEKVKRDPRESGEEKKKSGLWVFFLFLGRGEGLRLKRGCLGNVEL